MAAKQELESLRQVLLDGEEELAAELAGRALELEIDPQEILDVLSEAADELGAQYEAGHCFLPELFAGAEAMMAAVAVVLPALDRAGGENRGSVLIGTVEGDIHDIGKSIVVAMLSGAGFRIHDLGTDVKADAFVQGVREYRPDIVAASAYITTTSQRLPDIAAALTAAGLRGEVMYLIGGAAVSPEVVTRVGADGYGENAAAAVSVAREMVDKIRSKRS